MNAPLAPSPPVLELSERISEVLFGLIMVLTFTGSLSVAEAGRSPWLIGISMVALGAVLVALTIALGG